MQNHKFSYNKSQAQPKAANYHYGYKAKAPIFIDKKTDQSTQNKIEVVKLGQELTKASNIASPKFSMSLAQSHPKADLKKSTSVSTKVSEKFSPYNHKPYPVQKEGLVQHLHKSERHDFLPQLKGIQNLKDLEKISPSSPMNHAYQSIQTVGETLKQKEGNILYQSKLLDEQKNQQKSYVAELKSINKELYQTTECLNLLKPLHNTLATCQQPNHTNKAMGFTEQKNTEDHVKDLQNLKTKKHLITSNLEEGQKTLHEYKAKIFNENKHFNDMANTVIKALRNNENERSEHLRKAAPTFDMKQAQDNQTRYQEMKEVSSILEDASSRLFPAYAIDQIDLHKTYNKGGPNRDTHLTDTMTKNMGLMIGGYRKIATEALKHQVHVNQVYEDTPMSRATNNTLNELDYKKISEFNGKAYEICQEIEQGYFY